MQGRPITRRRTVRMSTDPSTIDFLFDQLGAAAARYSTRRMFGEYCLYREGLPVALVCDDALFVKDTPAGRTAVEAATTPELGPPFPGARSHLRLSPDHWHEADWLLDVLERTAAALPPPKPRKAKSPTLADTTTRKRSPPKAVEPATGTRTRATRRRDG